MQMKSFFSFDLAGFPTVVHKLHLVIGSAHDPD